jgi:hypothetical protein
MSDELKPQSIASQEFHILLTAVCDASEVLEDATGREVFDAADKLTDTIDALIAHINAWGARMAGVPAGWTLVPIEPTDAMCDAPEVEVGLHSWDHSRDKATWSECREIYKSMIDAAPAPQADKEDA